MEPFFIESRRLTMHAKQRCICRYEVADRRNELQHAVGSKCLVDELLVADRRDDTRLPRGNDAILRFVAWWSLFGVDPVDEPSRVVADELDQSGHAERLPEVLHVDHQHRDAREHEQEGRQDGDPGNATRSVAVVRHLPQGEDGVDEGGDEETDRELARPVSEDPLDDAGRELAHGQLYHDHRDGQDQRRQADHRHGDRRQDRDGSIRMARQAGRDRLIVEHAVERDRAERDQRTGEHAQHGYEPQAPPDMAHELPALHRDGLPGKRAGAT
jgi:hypothetical protein